MNWIFAKPVDVRGEDCMGNWHRYFQASAQKGDRKAWGIGSTKEECQADLIKKIAEQDRQDNLSSFDRLTEIAAKEYLCSNEQTEAIRLLYKELKALKGL